MKISSACPSSVQGREFTFSISCFVITRVAIHLSLLSTVLVCTINPIRSGILSVNTGVGFEIHLGKELFRFSSIIKPTGCEANRFLNALTFNNFRTPSPL